MKAILSAGFRWESGSVRTRVAPWSTARPCCFWMNRLQALTHRPASILGDSASVWRVRMGSRSLLPLTI